MNKIKIASALLLILAVSACSSSGGGGSSKSNNGGGSSGDGGGSSGGGSVVRFALPAALSEAPGKDGGLIGGGMGPEAERALLGLENALSDLLEATQVISSMDGSLTAVAPTAGSATLKGYVRFVGRNTGEDIVGNLEIIADFGAETVKTTATDLAEFRRNAIGEASDALLGDGNIDPAHTDNVLKGEGSIDGTTIDSSLSSIEADLPLKVGGTFNVNVESPDGVVVHVGLDGAFYENDDRLIAYGMTTGREGEFAASGEFVPSEPSDSE